jgi:hypothetical protein
MKTTYIYTTKKGLNKETFDSRGYVTLEREGVHIYEHHFGGMALKLQEQTLVMELEKRNIDYKTIKA